MKRIARHFSRVVIQIPVNVPTKVNALPGLCLFEWHYSERHIDAPDAALPLAAPQHELVNSSELPPNVEFVEYKRGPLDLYPGDIQDEHFGIARDDQCRRCFLFFVYQSLCFPFLEIQI